MKKLLSMLLAVLLLCSVVPAVSAAGTGVAALKINPYGGEETDIDTVSWFVSGGNHFLFLPADADITAAKIYFTASDDVTLDGVPVVPGDTVPALTVGEHTLVCGDQTVSLAVLRSENLPTVFIETESGSLDYLYANKEHKETAKIRVYEDGVKTLDSSLKSIKGRGNSTWSYAKKPFNIKFDSKTSLLGMPKAKKSTMLADYLDDSTAKTPAALALARQLGIDYTGECRSADVYFNGEYYGVYSFTESVEVGKNRVDIVDLASLNEAANPDVPDIEDLPRGGTGPNGTVQSSAVKGSMKWVNIPNDPADITGGYLLEMDFAERYDQEVSGFVSPRGQCVVIKAPEYASEAEVRYIAGLFSAAEEAVFSETGLNADGKHYSEYYDMEAFIRTYLLTELSKDEDAGLSSCYFYKNAGSDLLVAAPVWDFDRTFYWVGTYRASVMHDPDSWHANSFCYGRRGNAADMETVFTAFFRREEFRTAAAAAWQNSVYVTDPASVSALFSQYYAQNRTAAGMDLLRWKSGKTYADLENLLAATDAYFNHVTSFIDTRISILTAAFSGDIAMLYYDANGGAGYVFNRKIAHVGDSVTVLAATVNDTVIRAPSGKLFCGWNTKSDGTGTAYQPGDTIALNAKTTTLYAIWKTQAEIDAEQQLAADTAAANAVQTVIEGIGAVSYTDESKAKIDTARAAYDALTDAQKALVENYGTLTAAEARYAELKTAAETPTEPPTEPTTEPSGNNSSGKSLWQTIMEFFQRIAVFFRRLFGI